MLKAGGSILVVAASIGIASAFRREIKEPPCNFV